MKNVCKFIEKKTKHPTLLHIEYLVLRACSEKCSKLKENKRKYFSKKYQKSIAKVKP